MDKNTVFSKTDAGREALASRPPSLGPRLRSLLIMVDGKRRVEEFGQLLGGDGAVALLEQLEQQGWIEAPRAAAPAPAAASVAASAPAAAPQAANGASSVVIEVLPLAEARKGVVRFINDQLGPMGESLAMKVEACKTAADLQAQLPRIREGLRNMKGAGVVQQFDQAWATRLPPA
ncbi:hypothetical protein [Hydrogenophaga sp. IBVHS2]|uniref:hypothetical protein n=1 Tax=Hydrogenophaga sp. IBVHS2 TaxID=1985170 RepID=UPI000A2E6B68|nr:hypothetical protein [Hydrogenophaga sp. IBVHS2]OSZ64704.1 hypothetical protein CAP38_09885 [Hydrogenophaga sp. IBVHS2]